MRLFILGLAAILVLFICGCTKPQPSGPPFRTVPPPATNNVGGGTPIDIGPSPNFVPDINPKDPPKQERRRLLPFRNRNR